MNITIDLCKSCKHQRILRNDNDLFYLDCDVKGILFLLEKELFECNSFKTNIESKSSKLLGRLFK
jgi:hypothetical protein